MPRPHQREATSAILAARSSSQPGLLLGDMTGLGKTLSVWCAVAAMPERDVLIVCPKGAIPQWRRTIALAGCPTKTVTLINYERTKSLMAPPAASKKRSIRAKNNELAKHGQPRKTWPIVVFDESHRLRNPYAQQSLVCRQLGDAAAFSIFMSATAGQGCSKKLSVGDLGPNEYVFEKGRRLNFEGTCKIVRASKAGLSSWEIDEVCGLNGSSARAKAHWSLSVAGNSMVAVISRPGSKPTAPFNLTRCSFGGK